MSVREYKFDSAREGQFEAMERTDDRRGLLGLIALLGMAIPALVIRNLFPDLNPLFLAGLGMVVYAAYLGLMGLALLRQAEQERARPKRVRITVDHE